MGKRHPMSYNAKTRVLGECSTVNTVLLTLELKLFCSTVPYRICTKALGLHLHGESTWYTRHSNASCDLRVSHTRYAFNVPRMPVPPIHHAVVSACHVPTSTRRFEVKRGRERQVVDEVRHCATHGTCAYTCMRTNIDANIFWIDSGPIMFRSSYYNWNMFKVDSEKNAPCFLLSSTAARCELVWYPLLFHLILCPPRELSRAAVLLKCGLNLRCLQKT